VKCVSVDKIARVGVKCNWHTLITSIVCGFEINK
jgi:hypothetical protein